MPMQKLPSDSVILPTERGGLLVSRSHATFCGLVGDEVAEVERWLGTAVPSPSAMLVERLREHGFFDAPRPSAPAKRTVSLQLTNACNLRCGYCCTGSLHPRTEELGLDDWKRVVDDALATFGGRVRFGIIGGEPLLVPWSLDLAEYIATKPDAHLSFYTNGIGFREPSAAARGAALLRRGFEVRVSLAGATKETCDRQSGMPRFDRALAGLHALAAHGVTADVDLMLFPEDVAVVSESLPELRRRLPAGTHVSMGFAYHGGRETGDRVFGSRAALEAAFDAIVLEAGEVIPAPPIAPVANRREGCNCAVGNSLNVRSDGRLFGCFRMEEEVGDLRRSSFADTLVQLRRSPRPAPTFATPCTTCALATLCGGGCRTDNLLFAGDADTPPCGPWRVRILSELLAENRISCLEWSLPQLAGEARARGLDAPDFARTVQISRHARD